MFDETLNCLPQPGYGHSNAGGLHASSIDVQKKIEKRKNVAKGEKNMREATYVSHPYACSNVSSDCSGG